MVDHSYEEGVRDGRLKALEVRIDGHHDRLNHHDGRLTVLERVAYAILGIVAFIQLMPLFLKIIDGLKSL